MISNTLFAVAFAFAAQFTEGSAVSGQGCVSAFSGSQTTVVASSMAVFHNSTGQLPKQGQTFTLLITVAAFPQPCTTTLSFRPGFKLPAGITLVPMGDLNGPRIECLTGVAGGNLAPIAGCPVQPTEVLSDGTFLVDKSVGLWSIADGRVLQIRIPVTSRTEQGSFIGPKIVSGHVQYVPPDGSTRPVLKPQVGVTVYFNPPSVTYPATATTAIGPYSAHVAAFVDPHFNAGRIDLELAKVGDPFAVVDTGTHDGSAFDLDVESDLVDLDADSEYQWRYRYTVQRNNETAVGTTARFRTLPPPRFAYSSSVTGEGEIVTSPAPEADGTFIDRTSVTLTAAPAAGHRLVSFVVDGAVVSGSSTTKTIGAAVTATATFEPIPVDPVDPGEGEGEGEGEDPVDPGEGEGEDPVDPGEGEGEDPVGGEGEGEDPVGGEGEGEDPVGDDDDDDDDDGCSAGGEPVIAALLVLLRRRRRLRPR